MSGKVEIINNAIDLDKFKYDENIRKQKREEFGIGEDTKVIGHIGRLVTVKNHLFLIDVFNEVYKKNKNTILILAGEGPLRDTIKDKIKSLNLENNVKLLGIRKDVNELYQAFDVLVLPSLYEGLPVVGIEAQASGLSCILSDAMTRETKILDTSKFISLNETKENWADCIIKLLENSKREDARKQLRNKKFDIKVEAEKLDDFLLHYKKSNFSYKFVKYVTNTREYDINKFENAINNIVLISSDENRGYSAGNNVGIFLSKKYFKSKYIWILNNDTIIKKDALTLLVNYANKNEDAFIGATIAYYTEKDKIQLACRKSFLSFFGICYDV